MRVIGIDPGVTTGVVVWNGKKVVYNCEIKQLLEHPEQIARIVKKYKPEYAIVEDFVGSGRRSPPMVYTMMGVGAAMAACSLNGVKTRKAAPRTRYPWLPDAGARKDELVGKHAVDALAHAMGEHNRVTNKKRAKKD